MFEVIPQRFNMSTTMVKVDEISIIWCVWVEWAVPPRTCGHGGSVGALHTPKP